MTTPIALEGIAPAIVSPCFEDGRPDGDAFIRLAERFYAAGVHGLYVSGATGDGYATRAEDRRLFARLGVEISKDRGFSMIHVGTQDSSSACALAEHAASIGADAVASIPPANRRFPEIERYYRALASAAGGKPVFVYHIPPLTHYSHSADELSRLLDIPGVAGLKFTDYNLLLMRQILERRPDAKIFYGRDEQIVAGLLYGACGGIGSTYNLVPDWFVAIWQAWRLGNIDAAMLIQKQQDRLISLLMIHGIPATLEALLSREGSIRRCYREPAEPLDLAACPQIPSKIRSLVENFSPARKPSLAAA